MPVTLKSEERERYLAPLQRFYEKRSRLLPEVSFRTGDAVPEPYRYLLVHCSDMTPRLRDFHHSAISLEVLSREVMGNRLHREVILREQDGRAVEFGAILIYLEHLPEEVAALVRECRLPLGGILEDSGFPHRSAPRGYFQVLADQSMADLLGAAVDEVLFGRCNILTLLDGTVFAEIVEILPPVRDSDGRVEA